MKGEMAIAVVVAIAAGVLSGPASGAGVQAKPAAKCIDKAGVASGLTRNFAEYEAFLIIRQVTGNWPVQTDQISEPMYRCRQDGALWQCTARARVCRG